MRKLQASYNDDANKIVKEAAQEKSAKENLIFLIDLATIFMLAMETKPTKHEPQTFNKAWNHHHSKSQRIWQEAIQEGFGDMKKQQV